MADDTNKIKGNAISNADPENKNVLIYQNGEWSPGGLDDTMIDIDEYQLPTSDVTEVSGTIENLKVEKLLGKKLTTAVINGSQIPTGAILMFSPDIDAPNGAFHPSSGNPEPGEFLAWDHINDVWMPTINILSRLKDVLPPISDDGVAPVNNVLVYDFDESKYRSQGINLSYLSDVDVTGATDGSFLNYDGNSWSFKSLAFGDLSGINIVGDSAGKYLYHDGSDWTAQTIRLQDLSDVDAGLGEGKILIGKSGGQRYEYTDFKLEELLDINAENKQVGYVLAWNGAKWQPVSNKVESLYEFSEINVSNEPDGKYLYYDGSQWVDRAIELVTSVEELTNVTVANISDADILKYSSDTGNWMNAKIDLNELESVALDFTGQSLTNPTKKFLAFSDSKWRNTTIGIDEMDNVNVSGVSSGQALVYNGSEWVPQTFNLGHMSNVSLAKRADGSNIENGDLLQYVDGEWKPSLLQLQSMPDVSTNNIGANRILEMNSIGSGFMYVDYKMDQLEDVDISNDATGKYLYYDGDKWIDQSINFVTSMAELSDVSLSGTSDGDFLRYDSEEGRWVNEGIIDINDLPSVELDFTGQSYVNPTKKFLVYSNSKWRNTTIDISEITGLSLNSAVTGNVLKYNGSTWVPGTTVAAFNQLTGISLSGLADGDILKYNSSTGEWENTQESTAFSVSELESTAVDLEIDIKSHLIPDSGFSLGKVDKPWSSLYVESTGISIGSENDRLVLTFDDINNEANFQHHNESGLTAAVIDLRLQNGTALVSDTWQTSTNNIHALAIWDGVIGNKITQDYSQLAYNSQTNAVGFGVVEPEAKIHINMTSKSNTGGLRLSQSDDMDAFINIYQKALSDSISGSTVSRTPYLMHMDVNAASAAKYHDMGFMIGNNNAIYMAIQKDGETGATGYSSIDDIYVGIGTRTPSEKLEVAGKMRATSMYLGDGTPTTNADVKLHVGGDAAIDGAIYISGGADLAEGFHIVADQDVEPGTVVSIDPNNIGKLIVTSEAFDTKVAGVVSGGNGIKAGLVMTQTGTLADGEYPIALTGRVWVKCSNENGDISIGDLLTTASKPGHSMKASGDKMQGAILGKAMSTCGDNNMVLTLISLQ